MDYAIVGLVLHYGALAVAFIVYLRQAVKARLDLRSSIATGIAAVIGALIGGTLFAKWLVAVDSIGMVSWGVYVGAATAAFVSLRLSPNRNALWAHADAGAVAFSVAVVIARIGCFVAGCCFGKVSWEPWAVRFPSGTVAHAAQVREGLIRPDASLSLPVIPVQLFLAGTGLVCLVIIMLMRSPAKQIKVHGLAAGLCLFTYGTLRGLIEPLRADVIPTATHPYAVLNFSWIFVIIGISIVIKCISDNKEDRVMT